ncbi:MAG: nucleotidyltransferase domain-containing protein [Gammaproteobacteria bacterium]|nr:nucleotidyltransferase domain-containing protein [Gammaproteobacteria bacterium]
MVRQIPLTVHSRDLLEHRDEVLAEAKRCDLTNVRVFGSIARGDANETSDIDLLVSVVPNSKLGFEMYGLPVFVEKLTGRKVDMLFDDQLEPKDGELPSQATVRASILEDAIPL